MPSKTVDEQDSGLRFDRWLRSHFGPIPQSMIERWARKGDLKLDGKRVKPSVRVDVGQEARFPDFSQKEFAKVSPVRPQLSGRDKALIRNSVIYRDDDLIVLNKPQGLATQGGHKTTRHVDALLSVLAQEDQERPRLVHRLDKDTSGVLLVARSRKMAQWLTQGFKDNQFKKTYVAVVIGTPEPPEGLIDVPIAKREGRLGEKMQVGGEGAKQAQTRYRVLETFPEQNLSLLELQPLTGRTHQLRVHCAHMGCPILGDGKYAGAAAHPFSQRSKLHLYAQSIVVTFADGSQKSFEAPCPEPISLTLQSLRQG